MPPLDGGLGFLFFCCCKKGKICSLILEKGKIIYFPFFSLSHFYLNAYIVIFVYKMKNEFKIIDA
jgi:hypothetical protein